MWPNAAAGPSGAVSCAMESLEPLSVPSSPEQGPRFQVRGILVEVENMEAHLEEHVVISNALAEHLAGGVACDVRVLHSGRLMKISPESFRLSLPTAKLAHGKGRLLCSDRTFFNFLMKRWQPMAGLSAYLRAEPVLYCAFRPLGDALFLKVGYRSLGKNMASIINYLETKTETLRITNVPGAGVFVMPLPESHRCFPDPARAAEESLKSAVRCLPVSPTGHKGEFASFSHSMEYYFLKEKNGLKLLAEALRGFAQDPLLNPYRAVARGLGRRRQGRCRLLEWHEPFATERAQPALGWLRMSLVRSRQIRNREDRRSLKRLRAKSCP